jgi:hypothetical protein
MKPEDTNRIAERWLDVGLKELGQAEPRPGLEGRVLAHLQAEGAQPAAWWRQWRPGLAVVLVGVVAGSVLLLTRSAPEPARTPIASLPGKNGPATPPEKAASGIAPVAGPSRIRPRLREKTPAASASSGNASGPRLEQFPSPQPLSEQEKLLAQYVEERPQEAKMVARMRAELLKQDLLEFDRRESPPEQESQDRKQ